MSNIGPFDFEDAFDLNNDGEIDYSERGFEFDVLSGEVGDGDSEDDE